MNTLFAGTCKMDITPPVGYRLQGHSRREKPSEKAHDPLYLKILTVFDGKKRVAIVTSDLVCFTDKFVSDTKKMAGAKIGLKEKDLLLTTSHTHTGPMMDPVSMYIPREHYLTDYIGFLQKKICGGLLEARNSEEPVNAYWEEGRINIGIINRRKKINGIVEMRPNPEGPIDDGLSVLKFARKNNEPLAILFNYTCHPTTLSTSIYQISADYPGVAQREIESFYPGCTALFMNGCCGDVGPAIIEGARFIGGSFDDINRMGRSLAAETIKLSEQARPVNGKEVRSIGERINLDYDAACMPKTEKHLEAVVKKYAQKMPEFKDTSIKTWQSTILGKITRGEKLPLALTIYLQTVKIGAVSVVGMPGEVMVDIGLKIKSRFRKKLMLAGYANGDVGYLPTKEAIREGGYEGMYFIWMNYPAPYALNTPEKLIRSVLKTNRRRAK